MIARARNLVTLLALVVSLSVSSAHAHLTQYARTHRHSTVSLKQARRVARASHQAWEWKTRAHRAQRIGICESGLRWWVWNGEHHGWLQMNADARRQYGDGDTPGEQAEAAHRKFVADGWSWGAWSCA